MTKEPHWISLTKLGSAYEEEVDVNASPDASDLAKMRHRLTAFTGEAIGDWKPGPAPWRGIRV